MSKSTPAEGYALVTGASRGIGAAIARGLGAAGHPVLVNYRVNVDAAEEVAQSIIEAGGQARALGFDVRDSEAVCHALEPYLEAGLGISVLVNNAGIARDAAFPAMQREAWSQVIGTTLDGFFNVTQPLAMPMVRRRWGRIINIASVSGVIGNRGQTNYSAAKAGLIGATRSLALELARRGVTVNAITPGLIDTEMIADAPVEKLVESIPMRRLGAPEEVADLAVFLASRRAGYITGQVIGINGGLA